MCELPDTPTNRDTERDMIRSPLVMIGKLMTADIKYRIAGAVV